MHDNVDTSASVASSDGTSSPPDSSGADSSTQTLRVDFYVLEESSSTGRLRLACRLAEKAYLAAQTALVWHTDAEELRSFDDLLWTFMDGSFVPHEMLTPGRSSHESPVLLSAGAMPSQDVDIIINLAPEVPACLARTHRVAEIIDGDDARRRAGRVRFKAYRDLGVQPASHNIRSE
jgi:DNA polymerase III subunit chi